jgi:AraC-like DNA-binding protein
MTFNDYRNIFRVEHAKRLILDQQSDMITLEAVGLLSGFSNRNTFSRVFKELEGITPSAFAQNCSK